MSNAVENETKSSWSPKIVAFVCNWCTYTGADLAGTSRLQMDPNVRVIKLPCSSRVNPLFVIKALERGADGVIVSGCHTGDCHYSTGNYHARRRFAVLHDLLHFMGVDADRVTFAWVSASEGNKWQQVVNETTARVKQLGPSHLFQHQEGGEGQ
jgi:coenzyme F420-reducing hydrogenase delta subunit